MYIDNDNNENDSSFSNTLGDSDFDKSTNFNIKTKINNIESDINQIVSPKDFPETSQ